jgi:ElaB/YqjD/DUF883 family membrane-anchored ribosome-binding protein
LPASANRPFHPLKSSGIIPPTNEHYTMPDQTESASGEASATKLNDGKQHAAQAVNDLRAAAEAKAAELRATAEGKVNEIRGKAEHALTDARTRAQSLRGESEHWIRENPTRAVLTAMGVGFIFGLIILK